MPSFGKSSRTRLETCDPRLQEIFQEVVKHIDCSILQGVRSQEEQDEYFRTGRSKVQWPNSKHNILKEGDLSKAVDCAPYFSESPHIRWNDREAFILFAGFVRGVAAAKGYKIRWGGDWDSDLNMKEHSFFDGPHFEIVD